MPEIIWRRKTRFRLSGSLTARSWGPEWSHTVDSVSHFVDTWAAEHEADDSQDGTRKVGFADLSFYSSQFSPFIFHKSVPLLLTLLRINAAQSIDVRGADEGLLGARTCCQTTFCPDSVTHLVGTRATEHEENGQEGVRDKSREWIVSKQMWNLC